MTYIRFTVPGIPAPQGSKRHVGAFVGSTTEFLTWLRSWEMTDA